MSKIEVNAIEPQSGTSLTRLVGTSVPDTVKYSFSGANY